MKKRAFVTGGTGFTGSWLCKILKEQDYEVFALVRNRDKTGLLDTEGINLVDGDLSAPETLGNVFENLNIDVVFHIAAMYRQEGVSKDLFFKVNVDGTKALLDAAIRAGIKKFVHCSTVGVQGEIANPPATEDAPFNPGDHYQESKLEGEKLALSYFNEGKIEGAVVRPVGIYGPGDTRFLKLFRHINSGKFKMIGNGKPLYHLTFVEDLVAGIILAGEVEASNKRVYTIGGNEFLPLEDLVSLIADILGKKVSGLKIPLLPVYCAAFCCEMICRPLGIEPPLFRRRLDFFTKDRAFDITRAKSELGYKPCISLREGLSRTAEWYKEQKLI